MLAAIEVPAVYGLEVVALQIKMVAEQIIWALAHYAGLVGVAGLVSLVLPGGIELIRFDGRQLGISIVFTHLVHFFQVLLICDLLLKDVSVHLLW